MAGPGPLTARGVKAMLARDGFDYSALTITDNPLTSWVKIEGPKEVRILAWFVLFERPGLYYAPYTAYDMWSRR